MSQVEEVTVAVTTSSTGGVTGYSPTITGEVVNIKYEPDGTNPFATTADFAITLERSGIGLWTESNMDAAKVVSPRQPAYNQVGVQLHPSSALPATVIGLPIFAARDRVKVVIAEGGSAKSGVFRVVVA